MASIPFFSRLNGLLYRREFARLTPQDRTLAHSYFCLWQGGIGASRGNCRGQKP